MGASIREVLAESLLGSPTPLDWDEVSRYLREEIIGSKRDQDRMARHVRRQELYQDGGYNHLAEIIEQVIKDPEVKALRKEWVQVAAYNNLTRRIINEKSTLYQEPAKRTVKGKANNDTYQRAQTACRQHERARHWNRLGNLHKTLLVGVRVRNIGTAKEPVNQPRLDIITPAQILGLITSPRDPSRVEGAVIQVAGTPGRKGASTPHAVVWTNKERFYINREGYILGEVVEHGFDRMPLVLLQLEDDSQSPWPGMAGEDVVVGQLADWFVRVCLLKEAKSATKQRTLAGDLTAVARRQAMDSESIMELPDGVADTVVDMSMDLGMFRDTSTHIMETLAANNGIAPGILHHSGTQSAEARDLMRVPIRELRLEQHGVFREFERELAAVQAMVFERDMPELAFKVDGWHIDFADPQTPRSVKEQLEEFEHARRLHLTSTVKHVMQRNPDLTREQAEAEIEESVEDTLWLNTILRPLMQLSGANHGRPDEAEGAASDAGESGDESDDGSDGRNGDAGRTGEEADSGRAA